MAPSTDDLKPFLTIEALSGLVLLLCAGVALGLANSSHAPAYEAIWTTRLGGELAGLDMRHTARHWINDGLMAVFFLVVGLEIKREFIVGALRDRSAAVLPAAAALGGMLVPAAAYVALQGTEARGWAIPMATDIAFVVGCLAILGPRVPHTLKIFVLSLAIIDDLGAIVVVAVVYSKGIDWAALALAGAALGAAWGLVRLRVSRPWAYAPLAVVAWLGFHESGVHATLSGVLLGLLAPARPFEEDGHGPSLLHRIEHRLHPVVALGIMPIFALANAGVPLATENGLHPETLAVGIGLFLGKPLGIIGFSWAAVRAGIGRLPDDVSWTLLTGAGCLAGIGFTMSAFIASLAMEGDELAAAKLGVMAGSAAAGVVGMAAVALASPGRMAAQEHP